MFSGLIYYLYQYEVVDRTERDDVRTERTSTKQNERLLSILGRKSSEKIELFFKALNTTGQHHIRNEITGHEGGTSSVVRPLIMVALCNRADHYIFILFLLLSSSFFFFPRLISAVGDWMFTILWHIVWP